MWTKSGNGAHLAMRLSPHVRACSNPSKRHTSKVKVVERKICSFGAIRDYAIIHRHLCSNENQRFLGSDGSTCLPYRHASTMLESSTINRRFFDVFLGGASRRHSIRTVATHCRGDAVKDKDSKARLTALRLYRILQRLCGNLIPTEKGVILLQNDISASDWGHYHFYEIENDVDPIAIDHREDIFRIFFVLSGPDPISGILKLSDWRDNVMNLIPKNEDKKINARACWTTPTHLREAIRFAFDSSSMFSSLSSQELQSIALTGIQVMQDQVRLWDQSSVTISSNGLVRVTATSHCLGTVSPVSIDSAYSPLTPKYRFAYRIRVENISSSVSVQLLGRYWHIAEEHIGCDNNGISPEPIEVDAPYTGAVGQVPVLKPGQVFEYVSGTDLATPKGEMKGHFYMCTIPGDDVKKPLTSNGSKEPSSSSSLSRGIEEKDEKSNETKLFKAIVKPFRLGFYDE